MQITLPTGEAVLYDAEDHAIVAAHPWSRGWIGRPEDQMPVAKTTHAGQTLYLHNLIIKPEPGKVADHRDGNTLDCRRANLRPATYSQNAGNAKPQKNCRSAYKGVSWHGTNRCWRARVQSPGAPKTEYHKDEIEAARAYDRMARQHFGEFARVNFP